MKAKITNSEKTLAYLIFSLLSFSLSFAQSSLLAPTIVPPPTTSCSSSDLSVAAAKLTGGDPCNACVEGTQLTKTLTLSINNNTGSTRGAFAFWGTIEIYSGVNGSLIYSATKTGCAGPVPPSVVTALDFGTITYNCGDIIKISNIWEAWTTPSGSCPIDPTNISPKCGQVASLTVNAGVNGTFVIIDSIWSGATGSIDLTPIGGTAPYTYVWTTSDGAIPSGQQNSQDLTNVKPGTYTVKITDSAGCSTTKSRTVAPLYPGPAVFPSVADITVPCGGVTTSSLTYTNGLAAPFLISGSVTSILSSQNPAGPCGGDITESWSFTDALNRTINASRIIHVLPATLPTMTAPPNITVSCEAVPAPSTINFSNGLTGGCLLSGVSNLSTFNTTVAGSCNGKVTETWTAKDICGRTIASVSRIITIQDKTNPIITCPAAVSFTTDTGCTATNVVLGTPVTSDNCGIASVVSDHPSTTYSIGTTTVNWTVTDLCGNTATCTQTVTVTDNQKPTVTCAAPVNVNVDNGTCSASNVILGAPTVTDNCSMSQITIVNDAPAIFPLGTTTVTWTIKDAANNTTTCTQTVTVIDNQKPIVPALADVTGQCSATVPVPTVSDNCAGLITATTTDPLVYNNQGTFIVHWKFNDGNGNITNMNQNVIVNNNVPPSAPVLSDVIGQCSATVSIPTVVNSCDHTTVFGTTTDPLSYTKQGTYTVHWTFNDGNGNIITANQNVIIKDTAAPTTPTLANVTGECSASATAPTTTDVCAGTITGTTSDPLTYNTQGTHIIHWTFNDGNGNSTAANQNVIVADNQKPIIIACAAAVNVAADKDACTASNVNLGTPNVSDNCTLNPMTITNDAPSIFPIGITTVTWTIKDIANNATTCTQTVTVTDNQKPTVTACAAPVNVTADNGACTASNVNLGSPTVTDNCNTTPLVITNDAPTAFPIGTTTVTWTIKDASNNKITCTQTVTVTDNQKPIITTCATPLSVNADNGACTASNVNLGAPTVTDNCSLAQVTITNNAPSTFPIGTTTVTWTVKDAANNTTTCTQIVTVIDNQKPIVTACAVPVNVTADNGACTASNVSLGTPTVTDNCSLALVTVTNNAPSTFPIGTTTVTWTVKDAANNTTTCAQIVTVTDNQKPIITACAAPVSVNADNAACTASSVNLGTPTVTDNCSLAQVTITNNAPSAFPIGTTTVTWTVKDAANNSATCTQTVTVIDNQKPIITACSAPMNITADNGACTASNVKLVAPTVTDNCSLAQVTITNDAPAIFPIGTTTVTWTVKDAANNTTTCTQTVIVTDNQKPIVSVLADVSGQCSATVTAPTTSDNCAGIITATTSDPLVYNNQGTYIVHWTFNDGNGNITTVNQNVIVDNKVPPSAPVLADVIGQCSATVPIPTVVNSCDHTTKYGTTPDPLSYTKQGTYTVHWTFDDGNGNILTSNQKVIIADTVKPTITCAPAVSVTADSGLCTASNVNLGVPTTSDNCTLNPVTVTNDAPAVFPIGTTTVTWTVKDISNNIATCTQTVTVTDNQKPTVTACAPPVSVTADKDSCTASNVSLGTPTASDNCTLNPVTMTNDAPTVFPIGTTTVTWTIKDAANNTTTCTQMVTVTDNQKPKIAACAAPVSVTADKDACSASNVNLGAPNASDNCTINPVTMTNDAPTTFPIGITTVTWTIKDAAGNTVTCTQTVTVTDNQIPTVTACAAPISVTADKDACSASHVSLGAPTASDNCTLNPVTITNDAPTVFPIGTTTVTWTIKDIAGNIATCTQAVTVTDNQIPTITACGAPVSVSADKDACSASNVSLGAPTASDNCTLNPVTVTNDAPSVFPIGTTTVTWTIKDIAGNIATCKQSVIVTDNQIPTITVCAPPMSITADKDACSASNVSLGTPTASDNCTLNPVTKTNDAPSVFPIGTTTVTWTIKDAAGNIATCTQTVTVTDNQIPTVTTCAAPVNVTADKDACSATNVSLGAPTVTDNCSLSQVKVTNDAPAAFPIGTTTVTWTIKDAAGNATNCTQTVTVTDNQVPTITACAAPVNVAADKDACSASNVNLGAPTVTDNCSLAQVTITNDAPSTFPIGATTVTWTVKDAANNTTTCVQAVTVKDDQKPIISKSLADVIGQCSATVAAPTASDNCAGIITATTDDPLIYTEQGTFIVHWSFDDGNGNITTANQNVIVDNTIPPAAPVLADVTGECSATASIPTVVNNCYPNIINNGTTADPLTYTEQGTYVIHWTFDDGNGNIITANQNVIIHDVTAPVLSEAPADATVECSAIPSPATLTATDNCDANPTVSFSETKQDGNCPGNYTLTRTWTATDASGNSSSKSQKINVQDTTAPVFTSEIPTEISVSCGDVPHPEIMTAADNCGTTTVNLVETKVGGSCISDYMLTRTWTATDSCGNSTSFTQTINVSDTEAPTIAGTFQNILAVNCDAIPPIPQLEFSDNCSGVGEIIAPSSDDNIINKTDDSYTIIRTWNVSDLCGNTSTFIQTINVTIKDALSTASLDVCNADSTTYNLNTLIPQEYVGLGTWKDLSSSGGLKGDNDGIFSPFGIPAGNYTMEYDINDPVCPRRIQITTNVNTDCFPLPCGIITVHNFFSPNGDGYNDVFTIENIDDFTCYPTNRVRIYNRWGALLFETEGYDNNEKAFRGISQAGATINQAAELPSGTYFYMLEYTAENKEHKKSGYLYLSR